MQMTRNPPLPALTSVRFVFSIMVVATHFAGYHPTTSAPWMGPLGNIAVSWFFILSGFILAYNFPVLTPGKATAKFLIARFWRLFPVQAVTLLASYLLFESSRHLVQVAPSYLWRSLTLTHTWTGSPFAAQAFNVPAWSISHEWFFYLVFPLLIAWGWRSTLGISLLAAGAAGAWATQLGCWESAAAFQASGDSYAPTCNSVVYYWPPARLWEFALGIGICAIARRLRDLQGGGVTQIALVTAALALFVCRAEIMAYVPYGFFSHTFGGWGLGIVVGCMIILGLSQKGPIATALSYQPLVFAGEISFSIYMTHMLILRYAHMHRIGSDLSVTLQFVLVCLVSMIASAAIFLLVEQPSRLWLKSVFAGSSQRLATNP